MDVSDDDAARREAARRTCRPGRRAILPGVRRRGRRRAALAAIAVTIAGLIAGLLAGGSGAHAGRSEAASRGLAVLGFQPEGSPPGQIDRSARAMTLVGVDGVNLTGPGRVSAVDAAARAQLARARADGLPAVLLVGNWSERIGDFSERLAHETLRSRAAAAQAAAAVAGEVTGGGWGGVSVDLESLAPRDREGLTGFVSDLRADLPAADALSVCVEAFTSPSDYAANGYDLAALTASANELVLMTYDDHGPWEPTPGPIGPLAWQRASVRALERAVPPQQVLLGVANYGYAWRPHARVGLSVRQTRSLVARWRARPRWVVRDGEWTARLRDGSTIWWSDRRSVALRLRLARALGVDGVAVWSLDGDPLPGSPMAAQRRQRRQGQ